MKPRIRILLAHAVAVAAGVVTWYATSSLGKGEAWDYDEYWSRGMPALALVSAVLGFWVRRDPWRWGPTMMAAQAVTMLVMEGIGGNLLPLGLTAMAAFSLPLMLFGFLGAGLRGLLEGRSGEGTGTSEG